MKPDKLEKVIELARRGIAGERAAARAILEKQIGELPPIDWLIDPAGHGFDVPARNLVQFDEFQETVFRFRSPEHPPPIFRVPPMIASLLKGRPFVFGAYRIEAKNFTR